MTRQGRSTNNGYNNNNDDPYSYMQQQPKLDVAVGEEAGVGLGAIGTVGSGKINRKTIDNLILFCS